MVLIASAGSTAQPGQSNSEKWYQDARRVLDVGLQALGGIETFRRIDDISLRYTSKSFQQGQSVIWASVERPIGNWILNIRHT